MATEKKLWTKKREAALKAGRFLVKPSEFNGFYDWIFPDTFPQEEVIKAFEFVVIKKTRGDNYYSALPMLSQNDCVRKNRWGIDSEELKKPPYLKLPSVYQYEGESYVVAIKGEIVDLCLTCPNKFQQLTGQCSGMSNNGCNFKYPIDEEVYEKIKTSRIDFLNGIEAFGVTEAGFYPSHGVWKNNHYETTKPDLTLKGMNRLRTERLEKSRKRKVANEQYDLFCKNCVRCGFHCEGAVSGKLDKNDTFSKCCITHEMASNKILERIGVEYGSIDNWLHLAAHCGYEFKLEHEGKKRKSKRLTITRAVDTDGKFLINRVSKPYRCEEKLTIEELEPYVDNLKKSEIATIVCNYTHEIKQNLAIISYAVNKVLQASQLRGYGGKTNEVAPYVSVWACRARNSWGYQVENFTSNFGRMLGFKLNADGTVSAKLTSSYWDIDVNLTIDNYAKTLTFLLSELGFDD